MVEDRARGRNSEDERAGLDPAVEDRDLDGVVECVTSHAWGARIFVMPHSCRKYVSLGTSSAFMISSSWASSTSGRLLRTATACFSLRPVPRGAPRARASARALRWRRPRDAASL